MKPIEIAKGVYDVGVNDWNISDFHGYSTPGGTSYNAFLIVADEITLVDTVKAPFMDEMMSRIASRCASVRSTCRRTIRATSPCPARPSTSPWRP